MRSTKLLARFFSTFLQGISFLHDLTRTAPPFPTNPLGTAPPSFHPLQTRPGCILQWNNFPFYPPGAKLAIFKSTARQKLTANAHTHIHTHTHKYTHTHIHTHKYTHIHTHKQKYPWPKKWISRHILNKVSFCSLIKEQEQDQKNAGCCMWWDGRTTDVSDDVSDWGKRTAVGIRKWTNRIREYYVRNNFWLVNLKK